MVDLLIVAVVVVVPALYAADRIIKARAQARRLRTMSERLTAATVRAEEQQEKRQEVAEFSAALTSVMPAIKRPPLSLPDESSDAKASDPAPEESEAEVAEFSAALISVMPAINRSSDAESSDAAPSRDKATDTMPWPSEASEDAPSPDKPPAAAPSDTKPPAAAPSDIAPPDSEPPHSTGPHSTGPHGTARSRTGRAHTGPQDHPPRRRSPRTGEHPVHSGGR